MKKLFKRSLSISFFIISGVIGYYYQMQEKLIFKAKSIEKNYQYNFNEPFEEVNINIGDTEKINALHFFHENPKGVILYLHGQGKNLKHWGQYAEKQLAYGYDVFIIDYRGFGKSTNQLTEKNLMADSIAAYKYLKNRYDENQIVVHGVSLGTSMATYVSSKFSPKMCILVSPYFNMIETAHYNKPILPRFVLKYILKYHLRTDTWITKSNSPIHIFHGDQDTLVPHIQSKMIMGLLRDTNIAAELYTLEDWGHSAIEDNDAYQKKIKELLN